MDDETAAEIKSRFIRFLGFVVTCRWRNTDEWMGQLEDRVNHELEFLGDPNRVAFDGDMIRILRNVPVEERDA